MRATSSGFESRLRHQQRQLRRIFASLDNGVLGANVAGELERLKNSLGDPLTPPDSYRNLMKYTTRLADTAAIGDWSQFVVVIRQELRIEASRQANDEDGKGFSSYSVLVRATLRAEFAVLKKAAFYVLIEIDAVSGS